RGRWHGGGASHGIGGPQRCRTVLLIPAGNILSGSCHRPSAPALRCQSGDRRSCRFGSLPDQVRPCSYKAWNELRTGFADGSGISRWLLCGQPSSGKIIVMEMTRALCIRRPDRVRKWKCKKQRGLIIRILAKQNESGEK